MIIYGMIGYDWYVPGKFPTNSGNQSYPHRILNGTDMPIACGYQISE